MRQVVLDLFYGKRGNEVQTTPIDIQINNYLNEFPDRKVSSMSTIVAGGYTEAFVVIDIPEPEVTIPTSMHKDVTEFDPPKVNRIYADGDGVEFELPEPVVPNKNTERAVKNWNMNNQKPKGDHKK